MHFDRNGFGYTLDRTTGALLVAEKYDPAVNWATQRRHEDRPAAGRRRSTRTAQNGPDVNTKGICPAALGSKDQQPAAFNPQDQAVLRADQPRLHGLRAVQGRVHRGPAVCRRDAVDVPGAGRHATWATSSPGTRAPARSCSPSPRSSRSGAARSTTAGGIACYGTLEGYLKCVDANDINKELFKFKTPSGIIGNVFTYEHKGKQYVGVFSGIGGWAGIGMAAGLEKDQDGLGAVGGYKELRDYTELGGSLTVFALPQ